MSAPFHLVTIRLGSTGPAVRQWQGILGLEETGVFDEDTAAATRAWQRVRGLEPDGVAGEDTWAAAGFVERRTADIDDDFFPLLREIAAELSTPGAPCRPRDMLAVMFSESRCRATAHNDNPKHLPPEKRWNASGLIQFMPDTLRGLGWTQGHAAFRQLTATQQLAYVRRYYMAYRGQLGSVGALYTATFLPALVRFAGDPSYVLTATGQGPDAARLAWAYDPNKVFDTNKDFAITVGELEAAVARNCTGARWAELLARLSATDPETLPELPNPPSSPAADGDAPVLEDDGGASRRVATLDAATEAFQELARRRDPS